MIADPTLRQIYRTLIRIPKADVATTSRNVKRYVRAVSAHRTLTALLAAAGTEMRLAHLALTGGQLAEARRLLEEHAPAAVAR